MNARAVWTIALQCLVTCALNVQAQPEAREVVVTSASVDAAVFEILHGALAREAIALRRARQTAADCGRALPLDSDVDARVWLHISDGLVSLCFQDRCQSVERVLGPFARLDARAREEIIAVIESGLAVLPESCPTLAQTPVERQDESVGEHTAAKPSPSPNVSDPITKLPYDAPSEAGSQAPASDNGPRVTHSRDDDSPSHQLLLGVRWGITRWTSSVLGQYVGGTAAFSVSSRAVFVGFEASYTLPFRPERDGLAIDAHCLRLALQLWGRWSLSKRWLLDVQLGPALDALWLTPEADTARMLQGPRSAAYVDPYVFVRIGPTVRVHALLFLGVEAQLDAALNPRSYGYLMGLAQRDVFAPDRVRLSVALHARTEL